MESRTLGMTPGNRLARLVEMVGGGGAMGRRALAAAVARWRAARTCATHFQELANMSDRELLDIGIDRASIRAIAARDWHRDSPR